MPGAFVNTCLTVGLLLAGVGVLVAPHAARAQPYPVPPTWGGDILSRPRVTAKGEALLKHMRMLFGNLKDRASSLRPSSSPNELALLAAVFGIGAIPLSAFPYAQKLYPKAATSSASSCGSSCGSSSGSSCGGGGCGGGCGGCGG